MKTMTTFAALDLHSTTSVLGTMNPDGVYGPLRRFQTTPQTLVEHVSALGKTSVSLTLEASPLARWVVKLLRPHVERLVVCEPRFNRLVGSDPAKHDEQDVRSLCLLLAMNRLKEVWMGTDRSREILRHCVGELLESRDDCRELKAHIKARYLQWGVLRLNGKTLYSKERRPEWIEQLEGNEERRMMLRLYARHDHALDSHKETLREALRLARSFPEIQRMREVPGIGEVGALVFCAIIEDPTRFHHRSQLWKYSQLAITERTSDNKPLGYRRLDRRGNSELKTLSYHAWRTACRSTTSPNAVQAFYHQSLERTHDVRHARLNTQRKILETLWKIWLRNESFDPQRFLQTPTNGPDPRAAGSGMPEPTR